MWEKWHLKDNPYSSNPVTESSLDLFVGRSKEITLCGNGLASFNSRIVIEGGRGVGTTSLANYVKYTLAKSGGYLTTDLEISVGRNWNVELLISNVLAAVVSSLEMRKPKITSLAGFQKIKRAVCVIDEKFKSFGGQLLGFGAEYGKSSASTLPHFLPVITLNRYMKDLSEIALQQGYNKGIIIHLNNLDVNTIFRQDELRRFFNEARDCFQIEGYHWLFVGDTGLRGFIGSNVDRLDDIITTELKINPLSLAEVRKLIDKRMKYCSIKNAKISAPIDFEVISYLYEMANGRLRYIFGICTRLLALVSNEALINNIDLKFAKPIIARLAEERIVQRRISPLSLLILRNIVQSGQATTGDLTKKLNKKQTSISRGISELTDTRLVRKRKAGRTNIYIPSLDAKIAYSGEKKRGRVR